MRITYKLKVAMKNKEANIMKGRLLKKAAALSLAALLVTGGIPVQPIADLAREFSVTASAAETVTYI